MVRLIYLDKRTDVLYHWLYVFRSEAEAAMSVLNGDRKWIIQSAQDLKDAELSVYVLKELYLDVTGKPLRWLNRKSAEKKVFTAMSKLTKEEVKKVKAAVPPVGPSPDQVAGQVETVNETAEQKAERERIAAEKKEQAELAAAAKKEEAEKKKQERAEKKAERDRINAERKARKEAEKATRMAARANGPVDCPHTATIHVIKEKSDWPQFKGKRADIVAQLQDGMTVGEFVKAANKAVPGGGIGDVRIYVEKGMIELIKSDSAETAPAPSAEATTEAGQ